MSLRASLLVGMVVLVAAGLAVAAVATYEEQRSFLLDRVDQQVQSGLVPLAFELRLTGRPTRPARAPAPAASRSPACSAGDPRGSGRPACRRAPSAS